MNKGTYGYPLPPSAPTRVAPPEWRSSQYFQTVGTHTFTVPQNVYQVRGIAIGGGGNGSGRMDTHPANMLAAFTFGYLSGIQAKHSSSDITAEAGPGFIAYYAGMYYYNNTSSAALYSAASMNTNSGVSVIAAFGSAGGHVYASGDLLVAIPSDTSQKPRRTTTNTTSPTFTTSTGVNVPHAATGSLFSFGATNSEMVSVAQKTGSISSTGIYSADKAVSFASCGTATGVTNVNGLAYGAGLFVVAGSSATTDAGIATSPTGAAWTNRTSNSGASPAFQSVRFLNNLFVAVGSSGLICTSADGITWAKQTTTGSLAFADVAYLSGAGLYIAVGSSTSYATSPDGTTWTTRTFSLPGTLVFHGTVNEIVSLNGSVMVSCGSANVTTTKVAVASSIDGITWTPVSGNASGDTSEYYYALGICNGKYVASRNGNLNTFYYSQPLTIAGGGGGGYAEGILDVVPGQKISVTVGTTGGASSIGSAISATGGTSTGTPGAGFVTETLRGGITASGGAGGIATPPAISSSAVTIQQNLYCSSASGGAAGMAGLAGGAGTYRVVDSATGVAGCGGGGIFGGTNTSSTTATYSSLGAFGGAGAGYAAGTPAGSNASGGGGSAAAGLADIGGAGFSCAGGTAGSNAAGTNGGVSTAQLDASYLTLLLNRVIDGAGGGASVCASGTLRGGAGSGLGGGGGGAFTTYAASSTSGAGNGAIGGGGGGAGMQTYAHRANAGHGGMFGGGGSPGLLGAGTSTGYGGNGGVGGGGGSNVLPMGNFYTGTGNYSASGFNDGATAYTYLAGSGTAAPGLGGIGFAAILWTEGY